VANNTRFGLCSSVFTNNLNHGLRFIRESEVGLTHINMITAYKEPQLPFGGIRESGIGIPEAGRSGLQFFTRSKSAYVKF